MSKGFDLEPPKAPSVKKTKKGLFGRLFSSKHDETKDPEIPVAAASDIAALREKLGIAPEKTLDVSEHLDELHQQANATADEDSKQYDEEQASIPQEGSLDAVIDEVNTDGDTSSSSSNLFIDPSLVEEHNSALEAEQSTQEDFNIDDFSAEFDDDAKGKDESIFAQEEIKQVANPEGHSSFAEDVVDFETISKESKFAEELEVPEEKHEHSSLAAEVPRIVSGVGDGPLFPEGESPFAQEDFEEEPSLEESQDETESLAEDDEEYAHFQDDVESPFSAEVEITPQDEVSQNMVGEEVDTPLIEQEEPDIVSESSSADEVVESTSLANESLANETSLETSLEEESSSLVEPSFVDEAIVAQEESLKESISSPETEEVVSDNESSFADEAAESTPEVESVIETPLEAVIVEEKQESKKTTSAAKKKTPKKSLPKHTKEVVLSEEKKLALAKKASEVADKKFKKYLEKEEKITRNFLKKEKVFDKYIQSEKENFIKHASMVGTAGIVGGVITDVGVLSAKLDSFEKKRIAYEEKLQELYTKKYTTFSGWLKQEADLLRTNLESFEVDVKTKETKLKEKQKLINVSQKEILKNLTAKEKEYTTLTRKIQQAETKLAKSEVAYQKVQDKQAKTTEKLIDREVQVKASEAELEEKQKNLHSEFDTLSKAIEEKKKELSLITTEHKKLSSESEKLKKHIAQDTKTIDEKEKTLALIEKELIAKQAEVDEETKTVASLKKEQEKFMKEREKTQEMLDKREQAVLEKINVNEKHLRTIELKKDALVALEQKIEHDGFQSYLNAKLDQINPEDGVLSDEEHILEDSPELGSKIASLMVECKQATRAGNFDQAKKIYAQIREEYVALDIPQEEKALLYAKVRELYNDINLQMLQARSEVRSKDVA